MKLFRKFFASLALMSAELIVLLVLFIVALIVFASTTNYVVREHATRFDAEVFSLIKPYINTGFTKVMVAVSFFGSHLFLLPANILLSAYYLVIRKHRWHFIRVPVIALGSYAVMSLSKLYFHRTRPLDPVYEAARGFSYPSGHSMSAMTFFGLLIYIVWQNVENLLWKWILSVFFGLCILLIGFSRIYLRVHFASDVLAGFSLGIVWLLLSLWVTGRLEKYTSRAVAPVINKQS